MIVGTDQLDQILDLYHQGKILRAYDAAQAIGPMTQWQGAAARIVAGRQTMNLGAPKLGRRSIGSRCEEPTDPEAIYRRSRCVRAARAIAVVGRLCPPASHDLRPDGALVDGRMRDCSSRRRSTTAKSAAAPRPGERLMQRVDAASLRPCHPFLRGLIDAMVIAHRQRPFAEVRHYLESAMMAHPSFRQGEVLRVVIGARGSGSRR